MSYILTNSGIHFDLVDPQPSMIHPKDIIKGLSRESRFAGQTNYYYTVAQHCVLVSEIVPEEFALEALMHDASEAYLKDIPRPLKQLLPDYRKIEERVEAAIRERFGLPHYQSDCVTEADRILLATERRDLMPHDTAEWPVISGIQPLKTNITAVNYHRAEAMFMQRFLEVLCQ